MYILYPFVIINGETGLLILHLLMIELGALIKQ